MIFCTVGTHSQPFDRLVIAMDQYAAATDEKVIIQRGSSTYIPQHAEHFEFISYEEIQELYERARVVVAHAAAGAVILALNLDKQLIVVPRLQRYGEHIDDHQHQLARSLHEEEKAFLLETPTPERISNVLTQNTRIVITPSRRVLLKKEIREQLKKWT